MMRMNLFRLLIASTAVLSSGAKANIDALSHSTIDSDLGEFVCPKSQASLLKHAGQAAAAAYNAKELAGRTGTPLRQQAGFEDREKLLNEGYTVTSFSANVPG